MPPVACPQCGTSVAEHARYCGQCGFVMGTAPAGQPAAPAAQQQAPRANLAKTVLQFAAADPPPGPAPAPAPAPPKSASFASTSLDPMSAADRGRTMMEYKAPAELEKAPAGTLAKTILDPMPPPSVTEPLAPALKPTPSPGLGQTLVDPPRPPLTADEKRTMLGMPAIDLPPAQTMPLNPPAGQPQLPPEQQPQQQRMGTMLGVAMPGIAPLQASAPQAPQPGAQQQPLQQRSGTMLGVAVPGIAPTGASAPPPQQGGFGSTALMPMQPAAPSKVAQKPVTIIGMPAPFVDDEPVPSAPSRPARRGIPAVVVVGIVTAIVAVGGVVLFFMLRGGAPITAKPAIDAQGRDTLQLRCEGCVDGTVVSIGEAKATLKDETGELVLPAPLRVGDNALTLHIARPGVGREEDQKLVVPIAYRVRADLSTLSAKPAAITVRVDATPGSTVTVDNKPVALDAEGRGAVALDVSSELEGPSIETKIIERKVPYTITPKGSPAESGTVSVRVGAVVLRLDTPLPNAVLQDKTLTVAGQTNPGGTVTIEGKPLAVDAKGGFSGAFELNATGEVKLNLQASAPQLAPRTVQIVVRRADNLEAEAKAFEGASPVAYDAIAANITANVGQKTILEGEVVDATVISHQTIALVENRRGCSLGHCLARVVYGGDVPVAKGDSLRVYGRVARAFTASGKTLPEIEAAFIIKGRGR
jgi:hypothetical protein